MTLQLSNKRWSQPVMTALALVALVISAVMLSFPPGASAQPVPVTRLAYSAKYMCGTAGFDFQVPPTSNEYTVIEIHNPHTSAVLCTIKVVQDYPTSVIVVPPYPVTLPPNGALDLNCGDIVPAFFPLVPLTKGFVEITTPRQLKVVAIYKETLALRGVTKSASIAKKRAWPFFFIPLVRHSATCMCGDNVTAQDDTVRHETTVSLANVSNITVNAAIRIMTEGGNMNNFNRLIPAGGFVTVTCRDVPGPGPVTAGVTIEYSNAGSGLAFLECEEIIQKHVVGGTASGLMNMSVIEVQPIPLR